MKKIFIVLLITLGTAFSFAQNKSDYAGMWKVIVKAGNKHTTPTYLSMNSDFTYVWGIDSTQYDPMKNVLKGTWDITTENDIKFIPENSSDEIKYYSPKGENMYIYKYAEKDNVKTIVHTLEMDLYIQKIDLGN